MWPWRRESDRRQASRAQRAGRRRLAGAEGLESRQVMAVSILSPLPDVTLLASSPNRSIALGGLYDDTAVGGTVVRFDVNAAAPDDKVYVELFDAAAPGRTRVTPVTAANFLKYVDAGHYANTMVHRAVSGFVVQGGGFNVSASGALQLGTVTNLGTIVNEPGPVGSTNVRGTIAMAKVAGNPNSGSNQWFFNLADNTNPADENSLDRQNGGFTTFGRVLGSGMTAIDTIGNLPTFDLLGEGPNSVFAATPLRGIPNPVPPNFSLQRPNFVLFPAITRVGELVYSVTTDNPALVTPTIVNGSLNLAFASGGVGTATVSVRAQSVFDATDFKVDSFVIDRRLPFTPGATLVGNVEFGALPAGYALRVGPGNGQVIMVTTGGVNASATNPGAGWVAVGARLSGAGYEVFWRQPQAKAYAAWTLDATGARTGGRGLTLQETLAIESQTGLDVTGDGLIGVPPPPFTVQQTVGAVEFGTGTAGYALRVGGVTGQVIPVTFGGVNASATNPGAGWAAAGARQSGSGYEVLWRNARAGAYAAWTLNAAGARTGLRGLALADVHAVENQVSFDITGDGRIGPVPLPFKLQRAVGTVEFGTVPTGYALRVGGGNGQVIPVTIGSVNASTTVPGGGWIGVGARQSGLGYELYWRHATGSYSAWTLSSTGAFSTSRVLTLSEVYAIESQTNLDITSDGRIGAPA